MAIYVLRGSIWYVVLFKMTINPSKRARKKKKQKAKNRFLVHKNAAVIFLFAIRVNGQQGAFAGGKPSAAGWRAAAQDI